MKMHDGKQKGGQNCGKTQQTFGHSLDEKLPSDCAQFLQQQEVQKAY